MKQLLFLAAAILLFAACNNSGSTVASASDSSTNSMNTKSDEATAKKEVSELMNAVHNGFRQKNFSLVENAMAPDALVLGTDPSEVWPFSQFKDSMQKFFADTAFHGMTYELPNHQIEIDGNSAVVVDQFQLNELSTKMMTRNIAHARFENGKWLIDLMSWNVAPTNQQLIEINRSLQ